MAEPSRAPAAIDDPALTARLERTLRQQESLRAVIESISSELALRPEVQHQLLREMRGETEPGLAEELTARELDVLRLIARGRSNKDIAAELHLSQGTVKGYVSAIFSKLGVADRTQAALWALKTGVASIDDV